MLISLWQFLLICLVFWVIVTLAYIWASAKLKPDKYKLSIYRAGAWGLGAYVSFFAILTLSVTVFRVSFWSTAFLDENRNVVLDTKEQFYFRLFNQKPVHTIEYGPDYLGAISVTLSQIEGENLRQILFDFEGIKQEESLEKQAKLYFDAFDAFGSKDKSRESKWLEKLVRDFAASKHKEIFAFNDSKDLGQQTKFNELIVGELNQSLAQYGITITKNAHFDIWLRPVYSVGAVPRQEYSAPWP